jgi:energy-coupling factor transporter ATP-binding protein EcfA2/energy-coupling factor transporter transmembrane protein EcfT
MSNDLQVKSLCYKVNDRALIDQFEHQFKSGSVSLIIGRSGSGKTMLLELLSGLREPDSGEIRIGAKQLWDSASSSRKKPNKEALLQLGTAFQHPEEQLFARTIGEEFQYSLMPYKLTKEVRAQRIKSALTNIAGQLEIDENRDPFALSGGQKRRLTLSLLHATEAKWLLLDEPTAGIDAEGSARLCEYLQARKQAGIGTIIVTHDAEALMSAADEILILQDGRVNWRGTPAELSDMPSILEQAGLQLSNQLATLRALRQAGISVPDGWPDARAMAAAIAHEFTVPGERKKCISEESITPSRTVAEDLEVQNKQQSRELEPGSKLPHAPCAAPKQLVSRVKSLDPRAVWVAYMLVAPGILLQSHWLGWLASAIVVAGFIRFAEAPFREWSRPAAGLILFTFIASLFAGLTFGEPSLQSEPTNQNLWRLTSFISFSAAPAVDTFYRFSILVMIMLIGFVLLSGISHLRLKRSLEQGLRGLKRLRLPIDQFALTASLMIRFLPMLLEEWNRFARIAAARGKYAAKPGRIPIHRLQMTAIPYLMSMLRLGEMLSLILIVRGVGREGHAPTRAFQLKMNRHDAFFIAAAGGILLTLYVMSQL